MLTGLLEGLPSRHRISAPPSWDEASAGLLKDEDPNVRILTLKVGLLFNDSEAYKTLRAITVDGALPAPERIEAITSLVQAKDLSLAPILHKLLADPAVRGPALRGLAAVGSGETPGLILKAYSTFSDSDKADAIATLAATSELCDHAAGGRRQGEGAQSGYQPGITVRTGRPAKCHGQGDARRHVRRRPADSAGEKSHDRPVQGGTHARPNRQGRPLTRAGDLLQELHELSCPVRCR